MEATRIIIDTSILIEYFRKTDKSKAAWHYLNRQKFRFCASVVTKFEIYHGVTPSQKNIWDELFLKIKLFDIDEEVVDTACQLHKQL